MTPGEIRAEEPKLKHVNARSVNGINVAGAQTDLDYTWWDNELATRGEEATFAEFKKEHKSLDVNDSMHQGAPAAALADFRKWCGHHGLLERFDRWWSPPPPSP